MSLYALAFAGAGLFVGLPAHADGNHMLEERLAGRILLQVEEHGEAWYVDPLDHKRYFLGRPEDAFALMRAKGLGITNADLVQMGVGVMTEEDFGDRGGEDAARDVFITSQTYEMEQEVFLRLNAERALHGQERLVWNNNVAAVARAHSEAMARGDVDLGHDGFMDRIGELRDI